MSTQRWRTGLIALPLLLAGCASTNAATEPRSAPASGSAGMSMAPGDPMSGRSMKPSPSASGTAVNLAPSATAQMVCGPDIRGKVKQVLALTSPAPVTSTFLDHLYTCTYRLPMGPLVLSVKESTSKAAAAAYFTGLDRRLAPTQPLAGLGERAYTTSTGTVVVITDNMTLRVDATGLPPVFGSQHQKRTDLAYEIASDVLGCWTGDE